MKRIAFVLAAALAMTTLVGLTTACGPKHLESPDESYVGGDTDKRDTESTDMRRHYSVDEAETD